MSATNSIAAEIASEDVVTPRGRFGYGAWLQPIINANDRSDTVSEDQGELPSPPLPQRRGRGRPPVKRPRDESAIEKRRAQVREAQRAYQKRKDTATATDKHRADKLLQLLSDLSTGVESLLQAALTAETMNQNDEVSKSIQRLWFTYDTVMNSDCVEPDLRSLQLDNSCRLAAHRTHPDSTVTTTPIIAPVDLESGVPSNRSQTSFDPSAISFELIRFEGTTVMQSFQRTSTTNRYMAGKNIFDIMKERQAAMKEAERYHAESGSSGD